MCSPSNLISIVSHTINHKMLANYNKCYALFIPKTGPHIILMNIDDEYYK